MAERWQVPHGCHVTGKGSSAERRRLLLHALGKFFKTLGAFLVLLRLVGHFPISGLDSFLLHGQRPVHLREIRKSGSCKQNSRLMQKIKNSGTTSPFPKENVLDK